MSPLESLDQAVSPLPQPKLPSTAKLAHSTPEQARKAGVEFEGFFLAMVFENMFAGIDTDGLFGGGHGEKVFRSLMLQEYGKTVAERNGIGLAETVQKEILRLQEAQSHDAK